VTRRAVALAIVLAAVSQSMNAQAASAVARAFLQANTDRRWDAMADLVDAASLRALRTIAETRASTFSTADRPETRASLDSMGMTNLTRGMDGMRGMLGGASLLSFMFAGVNDAEQVRALSDHDLMARWFEAKSPGYLARLTSESLMKGMLDRLPPDRAAEVRAGFDSLQSRRIAWEVVGEVREGPGVAHVTYRAAGRTPPSATAVLTLQASGSKWYVHFTDPDDQLAQMATFATRAMRPDSLPRRPDGR
jgi:hypothetical protein